MLNPIKSPREMLLQAAGVPAMAAGGQTGDTGVPFNRALAKFKTLFNRAPNADEMAQIEAHAHKHVQGLRDGGTPSKLKAGLAKAKSYAGPAAMSLPIIYDMYDKIKSKDYPGLQDSLLGLAGNYAFPHPLAMVFNPFEVHGLNEGEDEQLAYKRAMNPYALDAGANNRYPISSLPFLKQNKETEYTPTYPTKLNPLQNKEPEYTPTDYKQLNLPQNVIQEYFPKENFTGRYPALDARTHSIIPNRENANDLSLAFDTNPVSPTMLAKYKLDPYKNTTTGKNWEISARLSHTQGTPFDQGELDKRIHSYIPGMSSFDNLD